MYEPPACWCERCISMSDKIVFTLEQIRELKYIIEDAGSNDAIGFIDEVAKEQNVEGYTWGRVIPFNTTPIALKISPELDEKYKTACSLCREKHKAIYGDSPNDCAFRSFDNEYCSDIVTAERLSRTGV